MKVSIIIPTVDNQAGLAKCQQSIDYPQAEVLVIKNQAIGFARAVNQGIRQAKGKIIVLLNDDVVLAKGCLKRLVEFIKANKNSYAQALVLKTDKTTLDTAGGSLLPQGRVKMLARPKKNTPIQLVSATIVAYPKSLFDQIGLFDQSFGSYLEDVDLSIRAKQNGWQGWVVSGAIAYHQGQVTSQKRRAYKQWHDFKNWLRLIFKHPDVFNLKHNWRAIIVERFRNLSGLIKAL